MKATNSLVVRCREKHVNWKKKTTEVGENLFFKALDNRFWLFMANLLSCGLHEKVNDMLLKVD